VPVAVSVPVPVPLPVPVSLPVLVPDSDVVDAVDAVIVDFDFLLDAMSPDLPLPDVVDLAELPFAELPFAEPLPFVEPLSLAEPLPFDVVVLGELTFGELFAPFGACAVTLGGLDVAFGPAACTNEPPATTAASRANVRNVVMKLLRAGIHSRKMPSRRCAMSSAAKLLAHVPRPHIGFR
jgi:hypothetical protein